MLYHMHDLHVAITEALRVLTPGGIMITSTNARDDKKEFDDLWAAAAAEVLNVDCGPRRISLSNRFALDDAPALLVLYFANVEVLEMPGVITVEEPEPVIAHLGSYRTWADQFGVPFDRPWTERALSSAGSSIVMENSDHLPKRNSVVPHGGGRHRAARWRQSAGPTDCSGIPRAG